MHDIAISHTPRPPYVYPLAEERLRVRLRLALDDTRTPIIEWSDRQAWQGPNNELPMCWFAADAHFRYWEAEIAPSEGRTRYVFRLEGEHAPTWFGGWGVTNTRPSGSWPDGYFHWPYLHKDSLVTAPAWVRDAIGYQIFPDRFARGNPPVAPEINGRWDEPPRYNTFAGGDLRGVRDHLDYITALGVNLIWFTPVFQAPSNHKYDTAAYDRIDPHFGDDEIFSGLVTDARQRGVRIILDGVFNHSGVRFAPWQDVLERGVSSPYWGWFDIEGDRADVRARNYRTFSKAAYMPRLMTGNPEVQAYLIERAQRWMRMGIAGWRLDVADEVNSEFWRNFRREMRAINPEAYLVGEISYDAVRWLEGDQFDGVMNYPILNALRQFVGRRHAPTSDHRPDSAPSPDTRLDGSGFLSLLSQIRSWYPGWATTAALNALSTHDIPRFLTEMGGDVDRYLLGMTFLMTYEGIPFIYYGDEVGMEGGDDPDCRRAMVWEPQRQNARMLSAVKALTRLRRERPALRGSGFRPLPSGEARVATYLRGVNGREELPGEGGADQTHVALVALNSSDTPATITISRDNLMRAPSRGALVWPEGAEVAYEPLTGKTHSIGEAGLQAALPAHGSIILTSDA